MIGWHYLVEIKGIKELALSAFLPTHRAPVRPPQGGRPRDDAHVPGDVALALGFRGTERTQGREA
jgi:hypothetical protein